MRYINPRFTYFTYLTVTAQTPFRHSPVIIHNPSYYRFKLCVKYVWLDIMHLIRHI